MTLTIAVATEPGAFMGTGVSKHQPPVLGSGVFKKRKRHECKRKNHTHQGSKMEEVKYSKDLKALGPAPAGHKYAGHSFAYWRTHPDDAFECYDSCKWDCGGKKQQTFVEVVPNVDLKFYQGSGPSWSLDDHDSTDCEHCGVIYQRIK